jgi:hypothetical protein
MTTTTTAPDSAARSDGETVGLVILDDAHGLGPRTATVLRAAARRIDGVRGRDDVTRRSHRSWPFVSVTTTAAVLDGAGRPGAMQTVVTTGPFMRPVLRISTRATDGARLMEMDPAVHLLRVARLVEGGDGAPDARDLRRVAVASALCDRDPAHAGDLVVAHSATAFEPAFFYDEGFRGAGRMDPRVLPVMDRLSAMIGSLPRITRTTIVRNPRGVPVVGVAPFADKEAGDLSAEDLDLVRWTERPR